MDPKMYPGDSEYTPIGTTFDRPLFGETTYGGKVINVIVGAVTVLFVMVTSMLAFFYPSKAPRGFNVYFAICICLMCASHVILILWYRQGDVDPKFRFLIYFNAFTLMLICVCSMCYVLGA